MQFVMMPQPGQVRQVQIVHPANVVSHQPAFPLAPMSEPDASQHPQLRRIKKRVLWVSLVMAMYIVLQIVVQYVFEVAEIQEGFRDVQKVTGSLGHTALRLLPVLLSGIPAAVVAIMVGLLVPLCGYFGARQNHRSLLCCFWSCNALGGCCSCLSLVSGMMILFFLQGLAPTVENFLENCDANVHCISRHYSGSEGQAFTVDCLAANTWQKYKPIFHDNLRRMPRECRKISPAFLKCEYHHIREPSTSDSPAITRHGPGIQSPTPESDMTLYTTTFFPPTWDTTWYTTTYPPTWEPERRLRRRPFEEERVEVGEEPHRHREPRMPEDPRQQCTANTRFLNNFHHVNILVPKLFPRLLLVIVLKWMLTFPVLILACLGFFWGKDLYDHVGYGQLAGAGTVVQQAPANVGYAMPVVGEVMAQPLMMHSHGPLTQQHQAPIARE